jgi:hypothetical protein
MFPIKTIYAIKTLRPCSRLFASWFCVSACAILASCTGAGTFVKGSDIDSQIPAPFVKWGTGLILHDRQPSLLVTIEYPGAVTERGIAVWRDKVRYARLTLLRSFSNNPNSHQARLTDELVDEHIKDQINKSGYYALQIFDYLRRTNHFPANTLALQAVTIDVAPDAPNELRVVRPPVSVPTVLTIRFLAFTDIDDVSDGIVNVKMSTFGNFIAPEFSLVTEGAAWPATGGAIMSVGGRVKGGGSAAFDCPPDKCLTNALDFGQMLDREAPYFLIAPLSAVATEEQIVGMQSFPYPKGLGLRDILLEQPASLISATQMPVALAPTNGFALGLFIDHAATQALSQLDPYLATRIQWKRYIDLFDKQLAARWPNTELTANEIRRLNYIKKIMHTEREVVSRESERFAEVALQSVAGNAFREQLGAEQRVMQNLKAADQKAFAESVLSLMQFMNAQLTTRGSVATVANALSFTQSFSQQLARQNANIESLASQFALSARSPLTVNAREVMFDGEAINLAVAGDLRSTLAAKYGSRFPQAVLKQGGTCANAVTSQAFSIQHITGMCTGQNASNETPFAFVNGETCYDRYNEQAAFVDEVEQTISEGIPKGPDHRYQSCLFVHPLTDSPGSADLRKCMKLGSPDAVSETVRRLGDSGSVQVTLMRSEAFSITSDTTKLVLQLDFRGETYEATDILTERIRPVTEVERRRIDEALSAWRANRAELMAYRP